MSDATKEFYCVTGVERETKILKSYSNLIGVRVTYKTHISQVCGDSPEGQDVCETFFLAPTMTVGRCGHLINLLGTPRRLEFI